METKHFTSALILAAGLGTRMRSDTTKQQIKICGKSVLLRSLLAFDMADTVDEIVVVCREEETEFARTELNAVRKPSKLVIGGATRRESAEHGFLAISDRADFIAVHDAARCMITREAIDRVVKAAHIHGAASAAARVTDTIKMVDGDGVIKNTVPRETLRAAQTPQVFSREIYEKALDRAKNADVTDDNMMAELCGVAVVCVETGCHNFKITAREDIEYAEFLIAKEDTE